MSKYKYGWDSSAKKKVYMGKYGNGDAGTPRYFKGADAGTSRQAGANEAISFKREFIGSGTQEYPFYSDTKGVLVVRAESYEEAWRIAKARGYSRRRYKR